MKNYPIWLLTLYLLLSCQPLIKEVQTAPLGVTAKNAMVVSAREEASKIGVAVMAQGGNAFDAMFATELALAVTFPYAGNLGGGGFMVYRLNNGTTGSLDYREMAPLAAEQDMYLDDMGQHDRKLSTLGAMAIGVPGTVKGIFEAHTQFGKLPVDQLIDPVIDLAQNGYVVTAKQEERLNQYRDLIRETSGQQVLYAQTYKAGDTVKNPALASTLVRLREEGADAFYNGSMAEQMSQFIQTKGGIIKKEDFEQYRAYWRRPIRFSYQDLDIISMGPPSSGGLCMGQIMGMIAPYDLESLGHNTAAYVQHLTEAERRAYADRSHYLGDPDFVAIPTAQLLDSAYLRHRMSTFSPTKATESANMGYGEINFIESDETTHYSIVDPMGNAVSVTTTINGAYGSKLFDPELGFFYNNEMDDFSAKPGSPNMFGLIGGQANAIAPKKRMLSSMTPTIVERNGELWQVLGTPGGSTIITSVLQVILNTHHFKMTMQQAVNQPRFHHQWLPDLIQFEQEGFSEALMNSLKNQGHGIYQGEGRVIGKVDAIMRHSDGILEAGADPRGDDTAVGF
ncbi:MAG: gamma-glutamyltransferase [Flavobacteriaceae bacterium]